MSIVTQLAVGGVGSWAQCCEPCHGAPAAGQALDLGEVGELGGRVGETGLEALVWGQRTSVLLTTPRGSSPAPPHSSSKADSSRFFPQDVEPSSPASLAGLRPYTDYVIGSDQLLQEVRNPRPALLRPLDGVWRIGAVHEKCPFC